MAEFSLGTAELGTLVDLGGLDKGIGEAERKSRSGFDRVGKSIGGALKVAVVAGAAAAVAAVATIGVAAFNVSNDIHTTAQNIQSDLNTTAEEAQALGDVAVAVFKNNFAGSIGEAGAAVAEVRKQLGDLGADDLQDATENAFRLRDAFDVDVGQSIGAARVLMDEFGLSQQEAFDLMASGFQRGLNSTGDFLESITEYANQFGEGGASAGQFFSVLESGLAGGVLGTDKAGDLFKEFRVRIQDGSKLTAESLAAIGINAEAMLAGLNDGSLDAFQAFRLVQQALAGADPATQMQAGVGLLGTQFEDLGASAVLALDTIGQEMESFEGSIDAVDARYDTLGAAAEGYKRRALLALAPVGDGLLALANDALPYVDAAFAWFENELPGLLEQGRVIIDDAVQFVSGLFQNDLGQGLGVGLGAFETVKTWIDENMPLIRQTVATVLGAITGFWERNGDKIMSIVQGFMSIVSIIFDTYLKNALDIVKAVMLLINGDVEGAGQVLKGIARRTMEAFFDIVKLWLGNVATAFGDIDWAELGRNVIEGIISGLEAAAYLLIKAVEGVGAGVLAGIKALLGIQSPSAVMAEEVGEPMAVGIAQGLLAGIDGSLRRVAPALRVEADVMARSVQPTPAPVAGSRDLTIVNNATVRDEADLALLTERIISQWRRQQELQAWQPTF